MTNRDKFHATERAAIKALEANQEFARSVRVERIQYQERIFLLEKCLEALHAIITEKQYAFIKDVISDELLDQIRNLLSDQQ